MKVVYQNKVSNEFLDEAYDIQNIVSIQYFNLIKETLTKGFYPIYKKLQFGLDGDDFARNVCTVRLDAYVIKIPNFVKNYHLYNNPLKLKRCQNRRLYLGRRK